MLTVREEGERRSGVPAQLRRLLEQCGLVAARAGQWRTHGPQIDMQSWGAAAVGLRPVHDHVGSKARSGLLWRTGSVAVGAGRVAEQLAEDEVCPTGPEQVGCLLQFVPATSD